MKVVCVVMLLTLTPLAFWNSGWGQAQAPAPAASSSTVQETVQAGLPAVAPVASTSWAPSQGAVQEAYPTLSNTAGPFEGLYVEGQAAIAYSPMHPSNSKFQHALREAFRKYQQAADDEARLAAKKELQSSLESLYDDFIDGQSKQIEELEARLVKLKEQLQKRRDAKSRMVDLKLQMVISQAEGLGFPGGQDSWGFGFIYPGSGEVQVAPLPWRDPTSRPLTPAAPSPATTPSPPSGGGAR